MPDYSGNTFNDINPQYPEDTELAGYHAAAMRQVKRFLTRPEGLEAKITEWITSETSNPILNALNKLIRVPEIGELYFTMDNEFNPNDEENQLYFNGTWEKISGKLLVSTGSIVAFTPNQTNIAVDGYAFDAEWGGTTSKRLETGLDNNTPYYRWFHYVANDDSTWFHYRRCYSALKIPRNNLTNATLKYTIILDELNVAYDRLTSLPIRISFSNNNTYGVNIGTELYKGTFAPKNNTLGIQSSYTGSSEIKFSDTDSWLIATYNCDNPYEWITNKYGAGRNVIASAMSASIVANFTSSYEVVADASYQESVPFIGVNIWVKTSDKSPAIEDV